MLIWLTVGLTVVVLLAYIAALCLSPKGYWATHQQLTEDEDARVKIGDGKLRQQRRESEVFSRLFQTGTPTSPDNAGWVREKLYKAIDYAIRRHDWYEDQRAKMFQVLIAVITIAGTFVGLVLKKPTTSLTDSLPLVGVVVIIFIALVRGIFLYNQALDADRPYRLVGDVRFWYFRYNLPDHSDILERKPDVIRIADKVLEERDRFLSRIGEYLDPVASLREDFEQLFILHVLQRYKHESLQRLRWLVSYTALALLAVVSISLMT